MILTFTNLCYWEVIFQNGVVLGKRFIKNRHHLTLAGPLDPFPEMRAAGSVSVYSINMKLLPT